MKNNVMEKVSMYTSRHPKVRFNLSHDVNSTYQFGEVQPVICKQMIPHEKDVVKIDSLVRLAPMVAPTFGRIKHKEWHHFIPFTDLFPHFGEFLADQYYAAQTPKSMPNLSIGALSYFCLIGAKCTLYRAVLAGVDLPSNNYSLYKAINSGVPTQDITNCVSQIRAQNVASFSDLAGGIFGFQSGITNPYFKVTDANVIDFRTLIPNSVAGVQNPSDLVAMNWPIGNFNNDTSWFDIQDKSVLPSGFETVTDLDTVSLESADAVRPYTITVSNQKYTILMAFRFSSFGRRLYKTLIGCGYGFDLTSKQRVSLMPLFAFYKAYFDTFGITRSKNWKQTAAYHILFEYDKNPYDADFSFIFDKNNTSPIQLGLFLQFICELGSCYVTEDIDFVSAHTHDQPVNGSAGITGAGLRALSFDGSTNELRLDDASKTPSDPANPLSPSVQNAKLYGPNSSYMNMLTALDVKELLKMYRWMNRDSIAGKTVENILRAQGYGYFLYSCKSNFIGYTEQMVPVYDVVNSADTFDSSNGQGMLLGSYAGRGLGYEESKDLSFEAGEHGYWIGLCAIVPESGYSQGLDASVLALSKLQFYTPEFDGLGFEVSPKSLVCASVPFSTPLAEGDKLGQPFGFIPRYSSLKVARNVSNGGFSLRSGKDVFRPYMLDKVIDVGERSITHLSTSTSTTDIFSVNKAFLPANFPEAGDWWRFCNRYPWLGNFDRIFADPSRHSDLLNMIHTLSNDSSYEYVTYSDDNFMVHHVVNQQAYANMLPISDSFGTEDDESGRYDDSMKQA